ncbi:hypothetical protein AN639_01870 [Candidatus Epulonipiscium fishelsonii]|uniref:Uncharacterized protein n=1 Tax=Candidatus Epulonipiscium fishelsonii TaxID=77094 RepID=A0ACC8X8P6_9FIRM|nr:hypothetical protein AN396_10830 [Epulopiscium sp. SCG-B11WGA-EpuloA1]ONI38952.1 hypothetical protein AN639_01870 [Epulopiscium sp. SCG-B05WGA-EpuloA1]
MNKSKLGIEILKYLMKSLITTLVISGLLFSISIIINQKHIVASKDKTLDYIKFVKNKFETFIVQENVKSTDIEKINDWIEEYTNIELVLMQDNKILYSTEGAEIHISNEDELELDFKKEVMMFSIPFYDENIVTFFLKEEDFSWAIVINICNSIISILIFITLFLNKIKNKVDYIEEIEKGIKILESGDLENKISQIGNDELANLVKSINNMSVAMKEKIEGEQQAQEANKLLITNISHDIRTPLTPIIGYLTILKTNKDLSEEQKDKFLDTALAKSEQLKERTSMLFEYALLYSNQKQLNKVKVNAKELIEQFIFESTITLNNNNFKVETNIDIEEVFEINIDVNELNRVFDNAISNILKYGDNNFVVIFKASNIDDKLNITLSNHINYDKESISTGLGNNICKSLVNLHGGIFEAKRIDNIYDVYISL